MLKRIIFTVALSCGLSMAGELQKCNNKSIQWSGGSNFEWPSDTTRSLFKSSGKYVSKNVMATRAAVLKDAAFVVFPRYKHGVPATLAKINLKSKQCQATLVPFPSWSFQEEGNCAALQSAVDVFLDSDEILWVLDVGIVNYLEVPELKCPPKVVAMNAKTGKIVKVLGIGHLTDENSRLQYLVADYNSNGRPFVYVSDAANRAILVLDVLSGDGYRLILPKDVTVGCPRRDVLYISLIRRADHDNQLLFTYLSGKHMFSISAAALQNGASDAEIKAIGPKKGKLVILGTDNASSIFFRMKGGFDVYKWNVLESPDRKHVHKVYKGAQYALPTQVVVECKRGKLRVLESNFPDYFMGTVGCGVNHALKLLN